MALRDDDVTERDKPAEGEQSEQQGDDAPGVALWTR
jgi:hypothetical protein